MKRLAWLLGLALSLASSACSIAPTQPHATRPRALAVSGQASITETDYSFRTRDGMLIGGKLTLPADSSQRAPVAVFIGGTGTWDSDYAQLVEATRSEFVLPIPELASQSARLGMAFIRYQKRGSLEPGGLVTFHWKTATLSNLMDDLRTLLAKIKADPRLDGSRIALVGHSEGTMIASWVGETEPAVKAYVMLGFVRRNVKDVFRNQLVDRNAAIFFAYLDTQPADGSLDAAEIEKGRALRIVPEDWKKYDANHDGRLSKDEYIAIRTAYYDERVRTIEKSKPDELVADNGSPAGWFQEHYRHETVGDTWRRIKTPVLLITGKLDVHTPYRTEAEPFEAMLKAMGHPDHQLVGLEGLDHYYKDKDAQSRVSQAFDLILPWLRKRLLGC